MTRFSSAITLLFILFLAGCGASANVITWETASEVNTAGFNIYRGPSEDGPWTQVNEALVPPSEDPVRGGQYEFTDTSATPGEVYYYMLEEVELTGASNRYPPQLLETKTSLPAWPWLLAGAILAVVVGWWLGKRLRPAGQ